MGMPDAGTDGNFCRSPGEGFSAGTGLHEALARLPAAPARARPAALQFRDCMPTLIRRGRRLRSRPGVRPSIQRTCIEVRS
jgi:hypothetical protein